MFQYTSSDFDEWRSTARELRRREVPPDQVQLLIPNDAGLFAAPSTLSAEGFGHETDALPPSSFNVPREFLTLAEDVGFHRDANRWNLLYRVLWRLTHNERHLMQLYTDDDIHQLMQMEKSVRRDAHKMKAFVRFREVIKDDQPHYIAWHRPDHFIVRKVAPFFSRRFKSMTWTILTPDE